MFDVFFWRDAAERAVKTAAQAVILAIGAAEGFDLFSLDWVNAVGVAAGGFVLSILTSLVSAPFGGADVKASPALWSPVPKDYTV